MKQVILTNTNGQYNDLLTNNLYFAYCNAINTKAIEEAKRNANLIIVCPCDRKENEFLYFFDLRDTANERTRRQGTTTTEALKFYESEVCDLSSRIGHLSEGADVSEAEFDILNKVGQHLEKAADALYDVWTKR